jgi:hypothetical protein
MNPDETAHDALNGIPPEAPKIYTTYVPEDKYLQLKKASEDALKELNRVNSFLVIDNDVIANLKNALV